MKTGDNFLFAFLWLIISFGLHPLMGTAGVVRVQTDPQSDSCSRCHGLVDVLPEGHSQNGVETVQSCADCHSAESPLVALGWMVHWKHYGLEMFPGDCWSCHSMEQASRFGLSGMKKGTEIEVSRDKVQQMSPY